MDHILYTLNTIYTVYFIIYSPYHAVSNWRASTHSGSSSRSRLPNVVDMRHTIWCVYIYIYIYIYTVTHYMHASILDLSILIYIYTHTYGTYHMIYTTPRRKTDYSMWYIEIAWYMSSWIRMTCHVSRVYIVHVV